MYYLEMLVSEYRYLRKYVRRYFYTERRGAK